MAEEALSISNQYGHLGKEVSYCAIKSPEKYSHINIGYKCAAAKGFFAVDPAGQIRTCNHSPQVVGNIFSVPIIQNVEYWNRFAESNYSPTMCKGCEMSVACDCGCREVANILNGNTKEKDTTLFIENRWRLSNLKKLITFYSQANL